MTIFMSPVIRKALPKPAYAVSGFEEARPALVERFKANSWDVIRSKARVGRLLEQNPAKVITGFVDREQRIYFHKIYGTRRADVSFFNNARNNLPKAEDEIRAAIADINPTAENPIIDLFGGEVSVFEQLGHLKGKVFTVDPRKRPEVWGDASFAHEHLNKLPDGSVDTITIFNPMVKFDECENATYRYTRESSGLDDYNVPNEYIGPGRPDFAVLHQVLAIAFTKLKPGGRLILSGQKDTNPFMQFIFSKYRKALSEAGAPITVVELGKDTLHPSVPRSGYHRTDGNNIDPNRMQSIVFIKH